MQPPRPADLVPWSADDLSLLKALTSNVAIPSCFLKSALAKECYDIHDHQLDIGFDQVATPHAEKSQLAWYDNKRKVLKWVNPSEARDSAIDTWIHRHEVMPKIKPCSHDGSCSDAVEGCHPKGLCNKFCLCPQDCHLRFTGCNCAETYGACKSSTCVCTSPSPSHFQELLWLLKVSLIIRS